LTQIVLEVDRAQFNGKADPTADIEIQFADTVSESQIVRAQTAQALRGAEAASTRTLVELVHNDWDGEQIDEEVIRIESGSDTGQAPAQPVDLGVVPGQQSVAPNVDPTLNPPQPPANDIPGQPVSG
jgi:hypothetical protein